MRPAGFRIGWRHICEGITDPVDAVAEAVATTLEWLPEDKHLGLLLMHGRPHSHTESVTSDVAQDFARSMLRRFDVDWAGLGFTDADLDELAEYLLRVIQSFVIDPGRPPRRGDDLRDYLRRWVGRRQTTVRGKRLPRLEHERRPTAELGDRDLTELLCRRVGCENPCRPIRLGADDFDVQMRVHRCDDRLQRALLGRADQRHPGTVLVRR